MDVMNGNEPLEIAHFILWQQQYVRKGMIFCHLIGHFMLVIRNANPNYIITMQSDKTISTLRD